jgi:hypothetical protein
MKQNTQNRTYVAIRLPKYKPNNKNTYHNNTDFYLRYPVAFLRMKNKLYYLG